MKKIFLILFVLITIFVIASCHNWTAKHLGGTTKVELEQGKKLLNVTWKEDDLWLLTIDRPKDEQPKTYQFKEVSNAGVFEGTVIIIER